MSQPVRRPAVAIVGAGPSGLRAAADLASSLEGAGQVLVLDRETDPGGIPRHCFHLGYGLRDLSRFISGPRYAGMLVDRALKAGADIVTNATVTGWNADGSLQVTSPQGRFQVAAKATVLATGARERPRSARRIPGDRPAGVFTTGQLQNLVHLHRQKVGMRAVVVGSELVSWSAVLTLRHASCATVLMTTEHPKPEVYRLFSAFGTVYPGVRVTTGTRVCRIIGRDRVQAVEIEHIASGRRQTVDCDTVVFTGDWIPDHELARSGGIAVDPNTLGPAVDTAMRTLRDGVFAIGNLVHPVDSADGAALDGAHVCSHVLGFLAGVSTRQEMLSLVPGRGFRWVSPVRFGPGDSGPSRGFLLLWPTEFRSRPTVVAVQDGCEIGRLTTLWSAAPGRIYRLPYRIVRDANPDGGDVTVTLQN